MESVTGIAALRPTDAGIPTKGNRAFGARRSPTHTHQGIDMLAPQGSPVRSVVDGTVTHASDNVERGFSGYGRHVVIRKGRKGPWLLFAHLETVSVDEGDRVKVSQQIGTVGDTCFDTDNPARRCHGYHLHFEVSPNRYPQDSEAPRLDPVEFLSRGSQKTLPARLLGSGLAFLLVLPVVLGFGFFLARGKR